METALHRVRCARGRLIKDARRKVFLILDNLNVHEAKAVREWLSEHRDRIDAFYLPPYSPELTPTEWFKGDPKREIHRGLPRRSTASTPDHQDA